MVVDGSRKIDMDKYNSWYKKSKKKIICLAFGAESASLANGHHATSFDISSF